MNVRSYSKSYLKIFLTLASPFLLLTLSNLFIPVNNDLTFYGYIFSFFASFFIISNLREKRILVSFDNRDLYLNNLKTRLKKLGYIEQSREGFLTTFGPMESSYLSRKIFAYIYKDSATIVAPKKYIKSFQQERKRITPSKIAIKKAPPITEAPLPLLKRISPLANHSLNKEHSSHLKNRYPQH